LPVALSVRLCPDWVSVTLTVKFRLIRPLATTMSQVLAVQVQPL
jgi:hypothetical protein